MKKLIIALFILIITSSYIVPSCNKECTPPSYKAVNVTVFEASAIITFTGEQGQGIFIFNEEVTEHNLPNNGTYQICASFSGGCGGLRVSKSTSNGDENIILVMPEGGTECIFSQTLASQYYASVNCE